MTHIFLKDLQAIYSLLFKDFSQKTFAYSSDYYWCVCSGDMYRNSKDMIKPGVGSLVDDFDEIKHQLKKRDRITNIDIDRFAYLIQAIAWNLPKAPPGRVFFSAEIETLHEFWAELMKRFKKSSGAEELCIEKEAYWIIEAKDAENFDHSPSIIQSSLQKDWLALKDYLVDQKKVPQPYNFELFARILRAIGQHLII